jgi:cytoskeletal protein RodZ
LTEKATPEIEIHGLGPYLSARRQALGLTLDEVANVTRISKSYLDAIEHEAFDRLPSTAYCKGFLRIYAAHLNLSADDVVARYERATGQPNQQNVAPPGRQTLQESRIPAERPKKKWFLPLVLLAVVIVLSMVIDTDHRPPPNRPEKSQSLPVVQPVPVLKPVSSAQSITAVPPVPETGDKQPALPIQVLPPAETTGKGLILRFKVNQDSWLNIDLDGRFSQQYELKAGDVIEWKADSVITVDLGNAGGVEAEFNGKALPPFGASGRKAHVVMKAGGISTN